MHFDNLQWCSGSTNIQTVVTFYELNTFYHDLRTLNS